MLADAPLHPDDFAKALRLGLGRAAVHLRHHDAAPYRDALLHACLHNQVFDRQVDGNHADYLYRLIGMTDDQDFYRNKVVEALRTYDEERDRDASLLFDLTSHFARAGDSDARRAIYERFLQNAQKADETGAIALIKLDGATGLIAVADALGRRAETDQDDWHDDYLLDEAKRAGVADPWQTLQTAVAERSAIQVYLNRVQATRDKRAATKKRRPSPAEVRYSEIKPILIRQLGFSLSYWGETASEEDLRAAAKDLLLETDARRLRRYLHIFSSRAFPLEPTGLIKLVEHPDRKVSIRAVHALAMVRHPDVRALALELIETPGRLGAQAVGLLVQNFAPGDHARVKALAFAPLDDESHHSLGVEINDFYDAHQDPDSEERVLRHLYENDPCSLCRGRIVLRLEKLGRLPAWMEEEIRYDADAGMYAELQKYRLELAGQKEAE